VMAVPGRAGGPPNDARKRNWAPPSYGPGTSREKELGKTVGIALRMSAPPAALGDPSLLKQVWAAGRRGEVQSAKGGARIEAGSRSDASGVTYVSDNGIGFDPREQERLFGAFQRLHAAGDFEGLGLGLAIVQRIVARHGGRVEAESRPGEDATFSFSVSADADSPV